MARLPRISVNGAIYLVTSRAPNGQQVFRERADYEMYKDLLAKYKKEHGFRLFAYCLLPERLHLVVEPIGTAGISKIMHDLNSNYTKQSNARSERRGPIFESRFKSFLVEKKSFLAALTRFVHRAPGDGMKDYAHSSYEAYASGKTSGISTPEEIAEVQNDLREKGISDYAAYCADSAASAELEKKLSRGGVLGSEEFVESVKSKLKEHTEALKETAPADMPSPRLWLRVTAGLLIAGSIAAMAYLYVAKTSLENKYQSLLRAKELEFYEKTSFENLSPIALARLDGTAWRTETVAAAGANSFRDALRFEHGKFSSSHFGSMGFTPAAFRTENSSGGVEKWRVVQKNSSGGTLEWNGIWRGDALKGDVTLRTAAGIQENFSFFSLNGEYLRDSK